MKVAHFTEWQLPSLKLFTLKCIIITYLALNGNTVVLADK